MGLLPRDEDEHLASIWLAHFGSPIPVYGAASIAWRILLEHGVEIPTLEPRTELQLRAGAKTLKGKNAGEPN